MRNGGFSGGRRLTATVVVIIFGVFADGCSQGVRAAFGSIEAGDRIRFCRGGAFDAGTSSRWANYGCRAGRPCRVTDYISGWGGGDEMRPIIHQSREAGYGFALENGGAARQDGGYLFENLDIRGSVEGSSARFGFFLYNDVDDVTIRNVHIEGFRVAVRAIAAPDRESGPGDAQLQAVVVRSNSIYLAGSGRGSIGVEVGGEGNNHQIVSNAIHYGGSGQQWSCMSAKLAPVAYTDIDYNLCYFPLAASGAEWSEGTGGNSNQTLQNWQNATGFDENSRIADPGFRVPYL